MPRSPSFTMPVRVRKICSDSKMGGCGTAISVADVRKPVLRCCGGHRKLDKPRQYPDFVMSCNHSRPKLRGPAAAGLPAAKAPMLPAVATRQLTLAPLMSRCTMRRSCRCLTARHICTKYASASSSDIDLRSFLSAAMRPARSPPSAYSITK